MVHHFISAADHCQIMVNHLIRMVDHSFTEANHYISMVDQYMIYHCFSHVKIEKKAFGLEERMSPDLSCASASEIHE
jgi:hypothetical protein